jgi:hypothetical protein
MLYYITKSVTLSKNELSLRLQIFVPATRFSATSEKLALYTANSSLITDLCITVKKLN